MDTLELASRYGTLTYTTSVGDTIKSVSRRIYHSDDEKYQSCIRSLNGRMDWHEIAPMSRIEYISKEIIDRINEL